MWLFTGNYVIVLQLVPQMPDKLFLTFQGEEVPLFTTYFAFWLSPFLKVKEGFKLNMCNYIEKQSNFYYHKFFAKYSGN